MILCYFTCSSYGEALSLAVQTSTIAFLVLMYADQVTKGLIYVSVYVACMAFLLSPMAPMALLTVLQAGNIEVRLHKERLGYLLDLFSPALFCPY